MSVSESPRRFVQFDEATINQLIDSKLTAAQYRAFLYFALVDPFGNRPVDTSGSMARDRLGIGKSTYYDAIARLQDEELFDFEDVVLRVRNLVGIKAPERLDTAQTQTKTGDTDKGASGRNYSDDEIVRKIGTGSETSEHSPKNQTPVRKIGIDSEKPEMRSPEPIADMESRSPHNLSLDLNTFSEISERERKQLQNFQNKDNKSEKQLSFLASSVNSSEILDNKRNAPGWINFSAPGPDPEFFQFVLARVTQFPQPPADNACVAEGWIQKQGHLLYAQYLAWKDERARVEALKAAQPEPVPFDAPAPQEPAATTPDDRLVKYQALWASSMMRSKAEDAIASHPEWGIEIGPDGPRLIEGFVLPPAMEPLVEMPEAKSLPMPSLSIPSAADVLKHSSFYPPEQQGGDGQQELWDGPTYAAG